MTTRPPPAFRTVAPLHFLRALIREEEPFDLIFGGVAHLPENWGGRRSFVRKGLEDHLLYGLRRGRLSAHLAGGERYSLPPGSVFWIHGGLPVTYRMPEDEEAVEVVFLRFHLGGAKPLRLRRSICLVTGAPDRVETLARLCRQPHLTAGWPALQARLRCADLLGSLLAEARVNRPGAPGLKPEHQRACLAYIRENLTHFFPLAALAAHCGLNPQYLSARFRATFGIPVQHFIKEARIREAQGLLAESRLRIGEVATRLGYRDPYYFSRQFKEVTGLSPRRWRERQSAGALPVPASKGGRDNQP